ALVALVLPLIIPLAFLLLPVTLRTCRVRRVHLLRITAYGLIWLPLAFWAVDLVQVAESVTEQLLRLLLKGMHETILLRTWLWLSWHQWTTLLIMCIAWQFLWWRAATVRYLKLPHASATTGLLLAAALVGSVIITATLIGPARFMATW